MQNKDTVMRFYTFSASIMNLGYKKSCRNFWEGYPGSFFSKFIPLQESIIKKSPPNNGPRWPPDLKTGVQMWEPEI